MNKFMNSNKSINNGAKEFAAQQEVKEVQRSFTPTITLYKDNCKVIMPLISAKEWQAEGWKSDEDLKKEAEIRIEEAKTIKGKDV